jgi:molybdenum cofactor sulfurtransferase
MPGSFPVAPYSPPRQPLMLSNESPILTISRSSIDMLNHEIESRSSSSALTSIGPDVFRANIVIRQTGKGNQPLPFAEEEWSEMRVTGPSEHPRSPTQLQVLGPCRRCQMVCINQNTGERGQEPFVTLAKTRARDGGVWFGVHCGLEYAEDTATLQVGDIVEGI